MNFRTRPHFEDRQIVQYIGESVKLSGDTLYANTGGIRIYPTVLDFTGATIGQSAVTINNLTGYLNDNNRLSGLVINPPILKLSGGTGTTTVNVENFVLKAIDSDGTAAWSPISGISWSVSACTSPFITTDIQPCTPGGTITINAGDLEINNSVRINDGSQSNGYVFTSDGSGNGSWLPPVDNYTTGATLNGTVIEFDRNDLSNAYSVDIKPALLDYLPLRITGNTVVSVDDNVDLYFSGFTGSSIINYVNYGDSLEYINGSVISKDYATLFNRKITNLETFSVYAIQTKGISLDYSDSGGTVNEFFVSKSSMRAKSTIPTFNGITYDSDYSANYTNRSLVDKEYVDNLVSSSVFTGNTSASCINDIFVSNIHSCSPLNINPLDEGNVYFGSTSGITIDVINNRIGIGLYSASTPNSDLDIRGTFGKRASFTTQGFGAIQNTVDLSLYGNSFGNSSNVLSFKKLGGTIGSPADLTLTTRLANIASVGYIDGAERTVANILMGVVNPTASTYNGYIEFLTTSGITSETRMFINYDGNIGVGTVSPSERLEVSGKTKTSQLQVTTSPINGYVLTSDNLGNATWQPSGNFTGNTSASCITDLYVTNLYGCSPITVWDSIQSVGSTASGTTSFAFGINNVSSGIASFAEGGNNISSGAASHAEGSNNIASGDNSHAEGFQTISTGLRSHSEGFITSATTTNAHAEGFQTLASGGNSHAEGNVTTASGNYSHSEGDFTTALGDSSHTEGANTIASGTSSHAEGFQTQAIGDFSHAEGYQTETIGIGSHAEGGQTQAIGIGSHAEGALTQAIGIGSHAEGVLTMAIGNYSHAEGGNTRAIGNYSHAGGSGSLFGGSYVFAEGDSSFVHQGVSGSGPMGTSATNSAILGGRDNTINSGATESAILGGIDNIINSGATASIILGGSNLTASLPSTVYVPDFVIKKSASVPVNSADPAGEEGSITWDNNYFYWKTSGGWLRISGSSF